MMPDKTSKKVAYIVPMGRGLDTFVYREVEALFDMGKKILLFSTRYNTHDVFSPKLEWPTVVLSPRRLALIFPFILVRALFSPVVLLHALRNKALIDLIFALHYAPRMRSLGAEQIHCHFGDHKLFIGYYCKRLTGLPLSVTIHAHEFYTNPNPRLFREAVLACDRVFPIAELWRKKLIEEYGCEASRVVLSRLFVDLDEYKPSDELMVISVGRFTERKGFQYLMQAIPSLLDLKMRYVFVGFGDLDLRKMAKDLGVSDSVTVFDKLGHEQLRLLYQKADIFCLPSITTEAEGAEGIPVVLMESMACGLPVVSTPSGATYELVEDILVDERSPEQLAAGLRRLAEDPDLRARYGKRNREIVAHQYSKANVERFSRELDSITRQGGD